MNGVGSSTVQCRSKDEIWRVKMMLEKKVKACNGGDACVTRASAAPSAKRMTRLVGAFEVAMSTDVSCFIVGWALC